MTSVYFRYNSVCRISGMDWWLWWVPRGAETTPPADGQQYGMLRLCLWPPPSALLKGTNFNLRGLLSCDIVTNPNLSVPQLSGCPVGLICITFYCDAPPLLIIIDMVIYLFVVKGLPLLSPLASNKSISWRNVFVGMGLPKHDEARHFLIRSIRPSINCPSLLS